MEHADGYTEADENVFHEDTTRLEQIPLNELRPFWEIGNTFHESAGVHISQFSGFKFVESTAIESSLSHNGLKSQVVQGLPHTS